MSTLQAVESNNFPNSMPLHEAMNKLREKVRAYYQQTYDRCQEGK